jgi:hypothetical protein
MIARCKLCLSQRDRRDHRADARDRRRRDPRLETSDGVSTNDPSKGVRRLPPSPTGRAPSLRSVTDPHSGKTIAQLRGMSEMDLIAAQDEIARVRVALRH